MVRKFEFTDILGWSHSRFSTFSMCKRQYYFQYYAKYDLDNVVKIAVLKKLTSVPLEIGNIAHKLIKTLLTRLQKTSAEIDHAKFFDYAERRGKELFRSKLFQEVYYKEKNRVDYESEIYPQVEESMMSLLESDRLEWLFEEALVEKDEWLIEPDGYGECRIEDMKAYCKVDFLFPIGDEIHVIDWKTGKKSGKHLEQLKGYAAWVHFHYEKDWSQIKPTVAYLLPDYDENSLTINEFDIEDFTEKIRRDTEAMYGYLQESELNIPKEKDAFPMTDSLKICAHCNFRELCGRE
jgi:hypothetical protein